MKKEHTGERLVWTGALGARNRCANCGGNYPCLTINCDWGEPGGLLEGWCWACWLWYLASLSEA